MSSIRNERHAHAALEQTCCTGRCNQGRACPARHIESVEQEWPWLWLVYCFAIGAAIAISYFFPAGWLGVPMGE